MNSISKMWGLTNLLNISIFFLQRFSIRKVVFAPTWSLITHRSLNKNNNFIQLIKPFYLIFVRNACISIKSEILPHPPNKKKQFVKVLVVKYLLKLIWIYYVVICGNLPAPTKPRSRYRSCWSCDCLKFFAFKRLSLKVQLLWSWVFFSVKNQLKSSILNKL